MQHSIVNKHQVWPWP